MKSKSKPRKIPEFKTIDEMARFWDTHDLTDYEDQVEDVTEPIFDLHPSGLITVQLKPEELKAVARIAKAKKTGNEPLIKRWIRQGIRNDVAPRTKKLVGR